MKNKDSAGFLGFRPCENKNNGKIGYLGAVAE